MTPGAAAVRIGPQPGPQTTLIRSQADIAVIGGAAGGGKSYGILMDAARPVWDLPRYTATIYRREWPLITQDGGLWDQATELYAALAARPYDNREWHFPRGARVRFRGMQHEDDRLKLKGAQLPYVAFDQVEEFTAKQFWYAVSRMRTTLPIQPKLRASCNPQPGWLAEFLAWWIAEDGFADPTRADRWRWFIRHGDELVWRDWREDFGPRDRRNAISVQFIPATLRDNPALTLADPRYEARLRALPLVERQRLLEGNWHVRDESGGIFREEWFLYPAGGNPADAPGTVRVRSWDKAYTVDAGAYTVGVLVAITPDGQVVIEDVVRGQWSSLKRERMIRATAVRDGRDIPIVIEQEPAAGKGSAEATIRMLTGWRVHAIKPTGKKWFRWYGLASITEAGQVFVLDRPWRQAFVTEAHNATIGLTEGVDQIDAAAQGFNWLAEHRPDPSYHGVAFG